MEPNTFSKRFTTEGQQMFLPENNADGSITLSPVVVRSLVDVFPAEAPKVEETE